MRKLGIVLVLLVAACGKRGDPRPPVPLIPKATSDLVVTQRGSKVILSWSFPSLTTAGQALHDIHRVVVYRAVEELPVPEGGRDWKTMQPGDVDPTVPRPIALFSKIPNLTPKQFSKLRDRVDSMESASFPSATAGAKLLYEDSPSFETSDGRPVRLAYAVVTESGTARSDLSNLATIVPLPVPPPPESVAATAKPNGIELTWEEPATTAGAKPLVAGYHVYRTAKGQEPAALGSPVNPSLVTGTSYTDVPPYGDYTYLVRAVVASGPPLIESDPSAPVTATFKDLLPPPAPTNVTALVETKSVRLVWDPVEAPDLDGYNIYRYQGDARLKVKLIPHPSTVPYFTDISVELGIEYVYAVTSVDKNGNESTETTSEKVMAPRTP